MSYNHDWEPINWKDYVISVVMAVVFVLVVYMAAKGM